MSDNAENTRIGWRGWVVRLALCLLVLLCPLKFGLVTLTEEVSVFPASAWDWVFGLWPPFLAPVLAGAALLLCVVTEGRRQRSEVRGQRSEVKHRHLDIERRAENAIQTSDLRPPTSHLFAGAWLFPAGWGLLTLCLLPGLIHTTEWDGALLIVWHWLGVTAFAVAVAWALARDRRLGAWLMAAVCAGTLAAAFWGWVQGPGGLLADLLQQAKESGTANQHMLNRLAEGRVFGTFVYPNSFAAHLILTGPLVVWAVWRGCTAKFDRVIGAGLAGAAALLIGGALWWSGSRSGMLALGGGVCVALALGPMLRRRRMWLLTGVAALAVAVVALGSWKMAKNWQARGDTRSFGSVVSASAGARMAYAKAGARMWAERPLAGVGLGEFAPNYQRLKKAGEEDVRDAHNMVLGFAAQSGLLAGMAALLVLGLPLFLGRMVEGKRQRSEVGGQRSEAEHRTSNGECRKGNAYQTSVLSPQTSVFSPGLLLVVQAGAVAWGLHALADFNCEIVGSVMVFALLPLLVVGGAENGRRKTEDGRKTEEGKRQKAEVETPNIEHQTLNAECRTVEVESRKSAFENSWVWRLAAVGLALVALAGVWRWPGERAYGKFVECAMDPRVPVERVAESARELSRLLPASPYAWNAVALRALAEGKSELALAACRETVLRSPHRSAFWGRLAEVSLAAGDRAGALRAAEKAVEWAPSSARYRELLERCRGGGGDKRKNGITEERKNGELGDGEAGSNKTK